MTDLFTETLKQFGPGGGILLAVALAFWLYERERKERDKVTAEYILALKNVIAAEAVDRAAKDLHIERMVHGMEELETTVGKGLTAINSSLNQLYRGGDRHAGQ